MEVEAIFADMDGTLIHYTNNPFGGSWDAVGLSCLPDEKKEKWLEYLERYYPRSREEGIYRKWAAKNALLLKGERLKLESLTPLPYTTGTKEAFSKEGGYGVIILSSGVNVISDLIKKEINVSRAFTNELEVSGGVFTGRARINIDLWRKAEVFSKVCKMLGVRESRAVMIGDHRNDIPVFGRAGMGVAFNPKSDEVKEAADCVIDDMRRLEDIL